MHYLYILRCSDHSLYCGQTNNLQKRIEEHNLGKSRAAKYTKSRRPVTLVYFERFRSLGKALKREAQIKSWTKEKKETLVKSEKSWEKRV